MELENILVTGARGFIGSHLVTYLGAQGLNIIPFEGDLLDKASVYSFFQSHPISQIIHLVGTFSGDLDQQLSLNFGATRNLLEVAEAFGVKKFIFASSGAVYGEPIGEVSFEDDRCCPNTWYGLSKRFAEEVVEYYTYNYGHTSIILRFPNVYGKGSRGVISLFQESIAQDGKIAIHGDGEQSRNFLHVSDAVHAIFLAISHTMSDIFNITNPTKMSLNQVVESLRSEYEFETTYLDKNQNNLHDLLLSGEKAKHILGFEAKQKDLLFE